MFMRCELLAYAQKPTLQAGMVSAALFRLHCTYTHTSAKANNRITKPLV